MKVEFEFKCHPCFGVVSSRKTILVNLCDFYILHFYRECNSSTYFLANLSHSYNLGFHFLEKALNGASQILKFDCKCIMYPPQVLV